MGFGQAFDDADAIITLVMLIPAFLILLVMTQNMANPEFNMLAAATTGLKSIAQAISPASVLALLLAFALLILQE